MTDQTVTLRITANADGTIRAVRQVAGELDRMGAEGAAGGAAASRGLKQVEAESRRASSALDGLVAGAKGVAAAFVSLQGAGALARIADEYTNLSSKIRLVTSSEAELRTVREGVFQVAQQTRQDLTATAELYTRLARSTAEMGLNQQQLLGITTTINQAFVVSGASAQEASAAITQLSQGLASGVLRGEEFNSVSEQAPVIMDLLAKQLNVTRGELRKMAEDGKLTADVLVNALGNGAEGVAEQFGKMQLTIGQATTQLRNAFTAFVGQADEANGASRAFAESISWLAQNLPTIANAAFRLGLAIAAIYSTKVLAAAVAFTVQIGLQTAAHIASTAALIRQQGVMATLFATQAVGFAASLKSIGAINLALGALTAGFAGWQIGTFLREEFLEVRLFGIAMVEGLLVTWERLKIGATIAWEAIKAAAVGYFNIARERAADLLLVMANIADATASAGGKVAEFFGVDASAAAGLRELAASIKPTTSAWDDFRAAAAAAVIEGEKNIAGIRKTTAEMEEYERSAEAAKGATEGLTNAAGELGSTMPAVGEDVAKAAERMRKALDEMRREGEQLFETNLRNEESLNGFIQGLKDEVSQIGLSEQARRRNNVMLELETRLKAAGTDPAYANQLRQETLALLDAGDAAEIAAAQQEDLRRAAEQAAGEYSRVWSQGLDNAAFAFGDFVSGSIRSFNELGDELKRTAQRMFADIVATFLRQQIIVPIQLAMAGGGGGVAGAAGQLLGGGGGGLSSILGQLSPASLFGNAAFNAGTSLFNLGGSLGSFGGGLASAGSNILGSGFFGSMGANLSGAFASFGSGGIAAGLGQLLPVVGQIAAIAGLVNSLSGGKLFGTKFTPDSAARQIDIGAGGAGGFESTTSVRQRSLFRGRQWREERSDLSSEVQEQIDQLFEAVGAGMSAAARALGVDVPDIIAGSFRQEFDKDGKLKREFSTIAGRVYEESQEAFGQRLLAENILATVGTRNGDASAIAERWRADAATLLDGSQFLLAAATDIRNGTALLTDGGLSAVTTLIEELANDSESLTEAYARVRIGTQLLEEALALSGLTLDRSREDFVRFAADIAEAAGGLDRAQALWSTYFGTFFSASERAEQALARARQGAGQQFADIGLDASAFAGEGGVVAFRQMFERVLPTLSAEAVVEWLEAAEALSGVLAAQEAYNDTLAESAREFDAAEAALRSTFEALSSAISSLRGNIATDIQGLRAGAPGFDAVGFQRNRITELRGQLAGASATDQVGLIDQIRQATLARFEAESDGIRRAAEQQQAAAEQASQAAQQAHTEAMRGWEAQMQAARRLRDFVDNLGLSTSSPLTAFERFNEAEALYNRALQGSDAAVLQQAAQAFLEETRNVFGVSDRAVDIFNNVRGALGTRADQLASASAPVFQAPAIESALGGTTSAVMDVEATIEALRAQAIADLEGLDGLLVSLRDEAELQFNTELEALRAQYNQHEANTGVIIDTMLGVDTAQADRDAAALDVMREQLAATQALVERADAQEAVTLRLLEQQEARLIEALDVVRADNERVARAVEQGLRAEVRR